MRKEELVMKLWQNFSDEIEGVHSYINLVKEIKESGNVENASLLIGIKEILKEEYTHMKWLKDVLGNEKIQPATATEIWNKYHKVRIAFEEL